MRGRSGKARILLVLLILLLVIITPTSSYAIDLPGQTEGLSQNETPAQGEPWGPEDKGTTIEKLLAWPLSFPMRMVEKLGEAGGFQTLDRLVFLNGVSEEDRKNLPWSSSTEKGNVLAWYWILAIVTAPFYAFAAVSAGVKMLKAGMEGRPQEREEAMDSLQRWLLAVVLVAVMPLVVEGLMTVCGILIDAISGGFNAVAVGRGIADWGQVSLTQMNFSTGSVLGTVILKVFFAFMWFYLNFLYIVRKFCLSVMLCFTPLAALIWAINRTTTAIPIWIGELASNAFMPVAHALVLCTILAVCDVRNTQNTWLTLLIALYTFIPLGEAIRNSMMSLIARLGGVSETGTALQAMGAVMGLGSLVGMGRAAGATMGTNLPRVSPPFAGAAGEPPGGTGGGSPTPSGAVHITPPTRTPLEKVGTTAAKVGGFMDRTAGTLVRAVGGAVPGGNMVADSMAWTVEKTVGLAAGAGRFAWETAKDPGEMAQNAEKWAGNKFIQPAKDFMADAQQVGKNVKAGAEWVGGQAKQGISWVGQQVSTGAGKVGSALSRAGQRVTPYIPKTWRSTLS